MAPISKIPSDRPGLRQSRISSSQTSAPSGTHLAPSHDHRQQQIQSVETGIIIQQGRNRLARSALKQAQSFGLPPRPRLQLSRIGGPQSAGVLSHLSASSLSVAVVERSSRAHMTSLAPIRLSPLLKHPSSMQRCLLLRHSASISILHFHATISIIPSWHGPVKGN